MTLETDTGAGSDYAALADRDAVFAALTGLIASASPTRPRPRSPRALPNKLDKSKVKFKFSSDEPDSTFECKLDKKKWKPCESPQKVKGLVEAKHEFKVRAIDEAGNFDPSPAKDRFKVVD